MEKTGTPLVIYLSIIYVHVLLSYENQGSLFCLQHHHFISTGFPISLVMYYDIV